MLSLIKDILAIAPVKTSTRALGQNDSVDDLVQSVADFVGGDSSSIKHTTASTVRSSQARNDLRRCPLRRLRRTCSSILLSCRRVVLTVKRTDAGVRTRQLSSFRRPPRPRERRERWLDERDDVPSRYIWNRAVLQPSAGSALVRGIRGGAGAAAQARVSTGLALH